MLLVIRSSIGLSINNSPSKYLNNNDTYGVFYVKRTGDIVEGYFTSGTYRIDLSSTKGITDDLTLAFQVNKVSPDSATLHADIEEVIVIGGDLRTDTFDANTIE